MALTPDFQNLVIHSDASILDVVAFHAELRDIEASVTGVLYPSIHTYKALPLGGGAIFPAIAFINGWRLQFAPGNYQMQGGNITVDIIPTPNGFVRLLESAAYAVTSVGGTGLSQDDLNAIGAIVAQQLANMSGALSQEEHDHLMSNVATRMDLITLG